MAKSKFTDEQLIALLMNSQYTNNTIAAVEVFEATKPFVTKPVEPSGSIPKAESDNIESDWDAIDAEPGTIESVLLS